MSKINKLLIVSSTYPSHNEEKVPAFVKDQALAFRQVDPKLEILVLAPHNKESSRLQFPRVESGIKEHRFHYFIPRFEHLTDRGIMPALATNKWNYLLVPFLFLVEFFALLTLVKSQKPDLIYAHWFTPQAINASIVSRLTNVPFVYTTHASDVDVWKKFGWLGKKIVHGVTKKALAITAVSTQTKAKLDYLYGEDSQAKLIPMGIHYSTKPVKDKAPFHVLFIGRLTEKKGLTYALPAIKEMAEKFPDLKLTIAGDGELMYTLKKQAEKLQLGTRVNFVGFVSGEEKDELLKKAGVMLVPSIITDQGDAEGLPVSLMEGLANGMLCIATDVSGADDIITDEVNGFMVKQKSSEALREALMKVFKLSEKKRLEVASDARKLAKTLDWPQIAHRHLELFNEAIDSADI